MVGESLLPLASLEQAQPEIYSAALEKYQTHPLRKLLPERRIEKLNCRWKDIVHFAPIHPSFLFQGIKEFFPEVRPDVDFFMVPLDRIRGLPAAIFDMNSSEKYELGGEDADELYELFSPDAYKMIETLPESSRKGYEASRDRGENSPLIFGRLPHVMVKGPVNIAGCKIVRWSDPLSW